MTKKQAALYRRLRRDAHALVSSATVVLRAGKPWPSKSAVPSKKLYRLAGTLNAISLSK
jgi:hypothetical protein